MIIITLFIVSNAVGQIFSQAVHDVVIKHGEPYTDLKNPEYPGGPLAFHSTIQWNLVVEADANIKIFCNDIRMGQHQPWNDDCQHVYLSFDEGNGETKICGLNKGGYRYISKSSRLTVKLVAKDGSGFVKCAAYNNREPSPEYVDLVPDGRIKFIRPPPEPQPHLDYLWALRSPPNTRISLQCVSSLPKANPCFKDILTIDTGEQIEEICGDKKVTLFTKENFGKVRLQLNEFGDRKAYCLVQAVTGPNANEFMNAVSEEVDSSEFGWGQGSRATSCNCGRRNKNPRRIIQGKETSENEYPWMVLLNMIVGSNQFYYCGASIISPRHVLTAAHCLVDKTNTPIPAEDVVMIFAEHNSIITSGNEKRMKAKQLIIHEAYLKDKILDIAIILTEENIEFNDLIGPICISPETLPVFNRRITVMGWGQTEQGKGSDVLLKGKARVVDNHLCNIGGHEICVYNGPSTPCYGDSGGPLVWLDPETNRYTQVSLVSRGTNVVCEEGKGISTLVSNMYDWIQDVIKDTAPEANTCHKV